MNETSVAGARPCVLEPAQLAALGVEEIFVDEGPGSGSASAAFAGPDATAGSGAQCSEFRQDAFDPKRTALAPEPQTSSVSRLRIAGPEPVISPVDDELTF